MESRSTYNFNFGFPLELFLNKKTANELHTVEYTKTRKKVNKKSYIDTYKAAKIHVQYARIIHQFSCEEAHASVNFGHEAVRRRTYVQQMLDEFGRELESFEGEGADFRSKVLTPVLQRQLNGVPDAYAPFIRRAISPNHGPAGPTLDEITSFYLGIDPLDPKCIPSYRRNLVYIWEARWHLAYIMGKVSMRNRRKYELFLLNHEIIMGSLQSRPPQTDQRVPPLDCAEVVALVSEEIVEFFGPERKKAVGEVSSLFYSFSYVFQKPDVFRHAEMEWERERRENAESGNTTNNRPSGSMAVEVPPENRATPPTSEHDTSDASKDKGKAKATSGSDSGGGSESGSSDESWRPDESNNAGPSKR